MVFPSTNGPRLSLADLQEQHLEDCGSGVSDVSECIFSSPKLLFRAVILVFCIAFSLAAQSDSLRDVKLRMFAPGG
ncbi:hypothetical protein CA13_65710 [Planctomycetes bacterium CA13]|uniref:Uncharacterized protein n=1 Tax=Novipirellula herctigrandis TaxID=2527986 RepID=A0A5C5ZCF1_9BACT|nr:hypothetical protein CA13_65710 [Planctomycetes bacterium CA13]